MPSHVAVVWRCFRWRRTSMTSCEKLSYAFTEFDSYATKTHFKGHKLLKMTRNIYSCITKGLLHWYRWILSLVGISTDARKLASFDIPTRDNIHRYQCNNPILSHDVAVIQWITSCREHRITRYITRRGRPWQHCVFYWNNFHFKIDKIQLKTVIW